MGTHGVRPLPVREAQGEAYCVYCGKNGKRSIFRKGKRCSAVGKSRSEVFRSAKQTAKLKYHDGKSGCVDCNQPDIRQSLLGRKIFHNCFGVVTGMAVTGLVVEIVLRYKISC